MKRSEINNLTRKPSWSPKTILALTAVFAVAVAIVLAQQPTEPNQPAAKVTAKTADFVLLPPTTTTGDWVTLLSNNIRTPNVKDLFITGTFEAGLFTDTDVTGMGTAVARATVQVRVLLDGQEVDPGPVSYVNRVQMLSANLTDAERIMFMHDSVTAAAFSFVAVDVPVGLHTVTIQARVDSGGAGTFSAMGAVGKGTMTVESVRLIRGEDVGLLQ